MAISSHGTGSYATASYALELDSQLSGLLNDFEGGDATSDVVAEMPDPGGIVHKHIAGVKYEDITVKFGADMSDSVYDWIAAMLGQTDGPKDGAIVALDMNFRAKSRLNFYGALLREITFPALDASSKEPGVIEVKFAPEFTRFAQASGPISTIGRKSQRWFISNFGLLIDGQNFSQVAKIDALTINRALASGGKSRGALNIPNLVFTIAESDADWLRAWHADFVINGNNGASTEKNGTLRFLQANQKDALFTLTLRNLGIFKLAPEKIEGGGQAARRLRAEMYCEEIDFQYAGTGAQSGRADTGSSGKSTDSSADATATGGKPPLRGINAGGLATAASSNSLTARQIQPPSPDTVINARNLGRPLKLRT